MIAERFCKLVAQLSRHVLIKEGNLLEAGKLLGELEPLEGLIRVLGLCEDSLENESLWKELALDYALVQLTRCIARVDSELVYVQVLELFLFENVTKRCKQAEQASIRQLLRLFLL